MSERPDDPARPVSPPPPPPPPAAPIWPEAPEPPEALRRPTADDTTDLPPNAIDPEGAAGEGDRSDLSEPWRAPMLADRIPCSQCGAMLAYRPGTRLLACEHCGGTTPIEGEHAPVEERDVAAAIAELEARRETIEVRTITCRGCGATTEVGAEVAAANCPYCGSHFDITAKTSRVVRPNALVPFAVPRDQVEASLRSWIARLWFAPNALKREAERERLIEGIYLPYWTYDALTTTDYQGQRGDTYLETVGSGNNRRTVMRTRWRPARGRVARRFDDVLVPASESEIMELGARVGPWELDALVAYDPRWVAGFLAEAYRIDLPTGLGRAKLMMTPLIDQDIRHDIGGDTQRIEQRSTSYADVTFKHVLLPLWLGTFRYRGRAYRFLVNGRSGAVSGNRPWSVPKIVAAVLAGLLLALVGFAIVSATSR